MDGYFGDLYNNIVDDGGLPVGGLWPSHPFIRRSIGRRTGVRCNCVWAGEESARRPYVDRRPDLSLTGSVDVNESPVDRLLAGIAYILYVRPPIHFVRWTSGPDAFFCRVNIFAVHAYTSPLAS